MDNELGFITRCEELGEAAVRHNPNTGPRVPLGTVLRAATLILTATALVSLAGCAPKSLPIGSSPPSAVSTHPGFSLGVARNVLNDIKSILITLEGY